jgi:hypothetical protein
MMPETRRNDDESSSNYTAIDVSISTLVLCLYIIGVFFHIKIIKVCKKEKEATWKLDIFNSCLILVHFGLMILMNGINYIITDLYIYTGKWLCYTYKAINMYARFGIGGHSFILSVMKYTIIVHCLKVRSFGYEKAQTIFFWINAIHSVCSNVIFSIVRLDYFVIYDGVSVTNRCLGVSDIISSQDANRSATKLHNMCEITEPTYNYSVEYFVYVCRTSLCWVNVIFLYLNFWNVTECFVYFKIFRFMNR